MLIQLLRAIGHTPTKETKKHVIYRSPFNPTEKTPSFFVFANDKGEYKNFKDYSSGAGGDIYKFVMQFFNIGFVEAKAKVKELTEENYQEPTRPTAKTAPNFSFNQQREKQKQEQSYKILKRARLSNKALLDYLSERKINIEVATKYLSEIYYQIDNKKYFALCFYNDKAGCEVRNKYFKGSFGTKAPAFIKPQSKYRELKIFEGFMDFLSYLTINKNTPLKHYLILNSVALLEIALSQISPNYELLSLYLDNDKAGDTATKEIIEKIKFCDVVDKRVHYKNYKDLNDFLVKGDVNI